MRERCEGGADDNAEDRAHDAMRTVRKERCRREKLMANTTAARDEVAIAALDQRYASLRLVSPEELGRVRTSIERVGLLSPVLVATGIEAAQVFVVDGFYADPSLMQCVKLVQVRGSDGPALLSQHGSSA